jgi:alkaline phosphatase D
MNPAPVSRRAFLSGTATVAALAAMGQIPAFESAAAAPAIPGGGYPFRLGVASGSPIPDGVVLWTRLVPDLFVAGGGMPRRKLPVDWEVATDPGMHHVVRRGSAWALPQLAHSVHVQLRGLRPDHDYFYRFRYRQDVTEVGHTRTAPDPRAPISSLAFAAASCQKWDDGYYSAYRAMAEEDIDFVLHLGDYVYEYGINSNGGHRETPVPDVLGPSPVDLPRWRMQYELHKSDPQLQLTHRRFPFLVTWDDHEVSNDYANTHDFSGDIAARRAAAYQAWYEHMPAWAAANPKGAPPRIYSRVSWGDLMQIHVLDGRQYRDIPPCGWGEAQACEAAYDPAISMLGRRQESWLYDGLRRSNARWTVLGSNVMMARLDHDGDLGDLLWNDAWDGFPEARNRLCRQIVASGVRNPMVLSGDWHSTFVNDIRKNFDQPGSPVIATEFVGTSISSNGDTPVYGPYYGPMIKFNPHIKFFDGDRRGYQLHNVDREQWRTDLRMVRSVARPNAPDYTYASFVVQDGTPGAVRV